VIMNFLRANFEYIVCVLRYSRSYLEPVEFFSTGPDRPV